jgi:hypothetical protein
MKKKVHTWYTRTYTRCTLLEKSGRDCEDAGKNVAAKHYLPLGRIIIILLNQWPHKSKVFVCVDAVPRQCVCFFHISSPVRAASGVSECVRRVACGIRRRLLHGAQHTNVHAAHQPVLYFTRVTCYCVCVCVCIARGDAV